MPTILVLDDDASFRQYLVTLLERAGYRVHAPSSSPGIRAALQAGQFDAVVADLYMPEADGIEVVTMVKRRSPKTPVVGITGGPHGANDPSGRAMLAFGAEAVLTKPIDAPSCAPAAGTRAGEDAVGLRIGVITSTQIASRACRGGAAT